MSALAHTEPEVKQPKPIVKTVVLTPTVSGNVPANTDQPEKRKRIRSALRAHREVILDFGSITCASEKPTKKLLHQVRQCAESASPAEGGQARLINLNEAVSNRLEQLLGDWNSITVIDREFSHSSVTRTTYSSEIVLQLRGWTRDSFKASLLETLFERDGDSCVWCGKELRGDDRSATLDHVLVRSEGGCDHIDNLVAACGNCNRRRGNLDAEAFLIHCSKSQHCQVNTQVVEAAIGRSKKLHADGPPADVVPLNALRRRYYDLAV